MADYGVHPSLARSKFIRGQCQLADQLKAKDLGGEVAHTQRLYEQYSAVRSLTRTTRPSLLSLRS